MTADVLDAALAALEGLVPGGVQAGAPAGPLGDPLAGAPAGPLGDPLAGVELPAVLAEASLDGKAPATLVLLLTVPGARRLAAALGAIDEEEAEFGGGPLGDRELGAVTQALAVVLAGSAGAADPPFVPGRPATRLVETDADARRGLGGEGHVLGADLTFLGEPARLALLVDDVVDLAAPAPDPGSASSTPLSAALRGIDVRVWAELGRTRMPTGEVVGLPSGAIVELDRDAEDAVDLYVDGQRYASGRLVVTDDDSWGVLVEHVHGLA
jgi:flagellar motor switch protein FliN/FliY